MSGVQNGNIGIYDKSIFIYFEQTTHVSTLPSMKGGQGMTSLHLECTGFKIGFSDQLVAFFRRSGTSSMQTYSDPDLNLGFPPNRYPLYSFSQSLVHSFRPGIMITDVLSLALQTVHGIPYSVYFD